MLDIKLIREHPEIVKNNLKKRHEEDKIRLVDDVLEYDEKWRKTINKINRLRHKRNVVAQEIAELKMKGTSPSEKIKEMRAISEKIGKLEKRLREYEQKRREILMRLPNILHESVPYGKDENDNVEIRRWGKPPHFDFEPKNHLEIALNLGLIDQERAAKVSGAGFFYLKDELVLLDFAIQRFAIDFLRKKGYTLIEPPFMITRKAYEGMIDPMDFEMVTYKIEGENLYLIATAEHPLGAMFMNEAYVERKQRF